MDMQADNTAAAQVWADLLAGNERFRTGRPLPRDLVRERQATAQVQHPKTVVLTCSDSRVSPEIIFDQGLGDLFVVRIAGNVVDKLALGSIEFAVDALRVPLLIVLGHQGCGGVTAARSPHPPASPNLKAIVKAIRLSGSCSATEGDLCDAVKQNARHIAREVLDRSELLHVRAARGELTVLSAYYSFDTGTVAGL